MSRLKNIVEQSNTVVDSGVKGQSEVGGSYLFRDGTDFVWWYKLDLSVVSFTLRTGELVDFHETAHVVTEVDEASNTATIVELSSSGRDPLTLHVLATRSKAGLLK